MNRYEQEFYENFKRFTKAMEKMAQAQVEQTEILKAVLLPLILKPQVEVRKDESN